MGGGGGGWRTGYKVFMLNIKYLLYIYVYSLRNIYTPKCHLSFVFVFVVLFCFFILFLNIFRRGEGGKGSDIKYLLYINVYYV